jgi:hypothetical protein
MSYLTRVLVLAASASFAASVAVAQDRIAPLDRTPILPLTRVVGEFPTDGLRYRLSIQDGQPSLYLKKAAGKEYDSPLDIWAGFYNRQRTLIDIYSFGAIDLPADPEVEQGPIPALHSPNVSTTATAYRLILWLNSQSPVLDRVMNFRMDSPKGDKLLHETPEFTIAFEIVPEQVGFELINKSRAAIRILWDECAYIDPTGRSFRVIHQGVRFVDRDKPMASTVVPPGASIRDLVYPASSVTWTGSRWQQERLYDPRMTTPFTFGVFLTMETDGRKLSATYKFAASPGWPDHIVSLFLP